MGSLKKGLQRSDARVSKIGKSSLAGEGFMSNRNKTRSGLVYHRSDDPSVRWLSSKNL